MRAIDITEKVWQGNSAGFQAQLIEAYELRREGKVTDAYCKYATAYYSHFGSRIKRNPIGAFLEFKKAKEYASRVKSIGGVPDSLSHGQCDVIGTIMLRQWLWLKANPQKAIFWFQTGLRKPNVPPHSRALLTIGIAEAYLMLGKRTEATLTIPSALAHESQFFREVDLIQARRQFCRVLRRAAVLSWKLGDRNSADMYIHQAREHSRNREWGSEDQQRKIELEWNMVHLPPFLQKLLPQ